MGLLTGSALEKLWLEYSVCACAWTFVRRQSGQTISHPTSLPHPRNRQWWRCRKDPVWKLQVTREGVVVELACPLKRGDGLVFDHGDPQAKEEGGQVYETSQKT